MARKRFGLAIGGVGLGADTSIRESSWDLFQAWRHVTTTRQEVESYPDTFAEAVSGTNSQGLPVYAPLESQIEEQAAEILFFKNFNPETATPEQIDQALAYFSQKYPYNAVSPEDLRASIEQGPNATSAWAECAPNAVNENGVNTALRDCPPDDSIYSLTDRYKADLEANANPDAWAHAEALQVHSDAIGELFSSAREFATSPEGLFLLAIVAAIIFWPKIKSTASSIVSDFKPQRV